MSATDTRPDTSLGGETYVRPGRLWDRHATLEHVGPGQWWVRSWHTRTDDGSVVQGVAMLPASLPTLSLARHEAATRLELPVTELPAHRHDR